MKVSIIITSYNYGRYLERCIRSCLNQDFPKDQYEVIVIDDQSTDETHTILNNLRDITNLRIKINKDNLGVAGTANEGIKMSRGQFVVRVDADDFVSNKFIFWLSEYLIANHNVFCVSCDYYYIDDFENKIERVSSYEKPVSCGIMYRKELLIQYGMYNQEWRHREEEELRKRLGQNYRIQHLAMPLYRYRMHKSNKTKKSDMMNYFKDKLSRIQSIDQPTIDVEPETDERQLTEYVVAVIPARGGSKRLPRKNIYPLWNKPMIYWAIKAAKESEYINDVYVSTEDNEIKNISETFGAIIISRPYSLSEGNVYKQSVICHATNYISQNFKKPTLIISLQANSPQVQSLNIDKCIDHLIQYKRQEVMSVDENLNQNAAIRVMTYNAVFQRTLSTNFGVVVSDLHDVHTIEDIELIEKSTS